MNFSPQQEDALEQVEAWRANGNSQVLYMAGYAGTGKTTLAQYLKADLYAAFTGKAAHVLRQKGCPEATTIHSLIYHPKEKSKVHLTELLDRRLELQEQEEQLTPDQDDEYVRLDEQIEQENANLKRLSFSLNTDSVLRDADLLVIDECSMVGDQVGQDLLSFGTKVLVLGDPAQLPPIRSGGFFTDHEPDILLTEVHRQARDNPILELATIVRETGKLPASHTCIINHFTMDMLTEVDQLLVGRNATRRYQNTQIRNMLNFDAEQPQFGDRIVCLRNNHELGILNGATYVVTSVLGENLLELDDHLIVEVHPEHFIGEGETIPMWAQKEAQHFDFGYALTVHKAQGSQWPSVGIINESAAFRNEAPRWLYTAITRASEKLWVTR